MPPVSRPRAKLNVAANELLYPRSIAQWNLGRKTNWPKTRHPPIERAQALLSSFLVAPTSRSTESKKHLGGPAGVVFWFAG